jgi:hypothetical protein
MTRGASALLAVLVGLGACSDDGASNAGTEGGPCRADGSCDGSLVCLAGICVQAADSGWADFPPPWRPDLLPWPADQAGSLDASTPGDGPSPDLEKPPPDLSKPTPDLPQPKLDGSPAQCQSWSFWSCIKAPQPKVLCWSTCPGAKGAIWCDGTGLCFCTATGPGNCGKVSVDLANPCNACKLALETLGCCK